MYLGCFRLKKQQMSTRCSLGVNEENFENCLLNNLFVATEITVTSNWAR